MEALILVGEEGFEPSYGRIKTCCLTTWRLPSGFESLAWARVSVQSGICLGSEAKFFDAEEVGANRRSLTCFQA